MQLLAVPALQLRWHCLLPTDRTIWSPGDLDPYPQMSTEPRQRVAQDEHSNFAYFLVLKRT